jgi:hypothetical protein
MSSTRQIYHASRLRAISTRQGNWTSWRRNHPSSTISSPSSQNSMSSPTCSGSTVRGSPQSRSKLSFHGTIRPPTRRQSLSSASPLYCNYKRNSPVTYSCSKRKNNYSIINSNQSLRIKINRNHRRRTQELASGVSSKD